MTLNLLIIYSFSYKIMTEKVLGLLDVYDVLVVVIYFVLVIGFGLWVSVLT